MNLASFLMKKIHLIWYVGLEPVKLMFENIIMAGPMAYHINYQVDLFQVTKQLRNDYVIL